VILGRRPPQVDTDVEPEEPVEAGKGRPTPKRAASRKARRNATPRNRKEAAALQRDRSRANRARTRQALVTGDERHLPPRDAGPEKRLARDIVDVRFTIGQAFFGLIFVAFGASLVNNQVVRNIGSFAALIFLLVMVLDGFRNGRRARDAVTAKYGAARAQGISSYAFMRALLPRRFRRPPCKVSRGDPVTP